MVFIPLFIRDNYEIKRELGRGIYGVTYEVVSKKDGRKYVAKIYDKEKILNILGEKKMSPTLNRMLENNREVMELLKRKACENVKKIYHVGDEDNPFVVSEYLNYNLKDFIRERGISHQLALKIMLDVTRGLKFVFDGTGFYCHGDVSPDNIFVCEQGGQLVAKIGDFEGAASPTASVPVLLFKPEYRPPETTPDKDGRYDVYSLGVILAELILGEMGGRRIKDEGERVVDEFLIAKELKDLIRGAAALGREKRFTLDEFIKKLEAALKLSPPTSLSPPLEDPWKEIEKEVREIASQYLECLEKLREKPERNKFNRIKKVIDPKFDELIKLREERKDESIQKIKELISYLRKELSFVR